MSMNDPKVEIWSLAGGYWRLPIRVTWHQNLGEVRVSAGVRLTSKMIAAADEVLAKIGSQKGNTFWIERQNLETTARKFHGEDPEDVVEWLPSRKNEAPEIRQDYNPDEFIQSYCASSHAVLRDTMLMDRIWVSLCRFMMDYMLNTQKPINLLFARLDAFCFRKNWMSATAKRERALLRTNKMFRSDYLSPERESMARRGVWEYLTSEWVTAFDTKNRFPCWTIEVTTNEAWDKVITKWEAAKLAARRGAYRNGAVEQMLRQARRALEIYARYLEETSKPATELVRSSFGGVGNHFRLVTGSRQATTPPGPWDGNLEVSDAVEESSSQTMAAENPGVHEVPDLESKDEDVRDSG